MLPLGKPPTAAQLTYTPSQGYIDLSYPETVRWEADVLAAEKELDTLLVKAGEEARLAAETVSQDLMKNASSAQREKLLDESCYFASRLIDVLVYENWMRANPANFGRFRFGSLPGYRLFMPVVSRMASPMRYTLMLNLCPTFIP